MSTAKRERSKAWRWGVCGMLLLATMINYMDRQTLANASVRITREFGLNQEGYGVLETGFGYAFAVGSVVFGFAADRFSVRWVYPTIVVLWSLMGILTGWARNHEELLVCRTLLGFFEAGHWPCAIRTTQALLESKDRTMGNGVLQSGAAVGAIITPVVMVHFMTGEVGSWRPVFQGIGAVGLLWVAAWLWVVRAGDLPTPERGKPVMGGEAGGSIWRIMVSRRFLVLLFTLAMINVAWHVLRVWLPKFLIEGRGYTETQALYFNSLFFVATDVGCLSAGALTLLLARRGLSVHGSRLLVFLVCGVLTSFTAVAAVLPAGWLMLGALLLVASGVMGLFPCYHAFTQEISTRHMGKVSGLISAFGWVASGFVHARFGRMIDFTGSFDLGLTIAGSLPLAAFLALFFFWDRPGHREGITRAGKRPGTEGGDVASC